MNFIADFHIHSKYSRATAKNLDFENLYISAQIKGITVIGTGDFTHPAWWREIIEKLEPAQEGLLALKPEIAAQCDAKVPPACRRPVRFMLTTEISNIYKKNGQTRKNHNLVFMPDLESAVRFSRRLDKIGNIRSDGRPILGLDARNLLEIVLETTPCGFLIPAHIWTPWFSLLGSKSGFDTVEACFEDLSEHIFALETGLSSDPPMNWRVSSLDRFTLISNSDAHSPAKLGREANLFNTELSYPAIYEALKNADPERFLGTMEFFPEEGKYHVDGHRNCNFRCQPSETRTLHNTCPVCGKPLTLGVLYRVEALADRPADAKAPKARPYQSLIPLQEVLAEVFATSAGTQKVLRAYNKLIQRHGAELDILRQVPRHELDRDGIALLGEAIDRMRAGQVIFDPGYDGEFGQVRIFSTDEREALKGQAPIFHVKESPGHIPLPPTPVPAKTKPNETAIEPPSAMPLRIEPALKLNAEQQSVVDYGQGALLIAAGPGTGKTRAITSRMAALIQSGVSAETILAVTFTNKAAQELRQRLAAVLEPGVALPVTATFHGLCYGLLQEKRVPNHFSLLDDEGRAAIMADVLEILKSSAGTKKISIPKAVDFIVQAKQQLLGSGDDLSSLTAKQPNKGIPFGDLALIYTTYQGVLSWQGLVDFEDLIVETVHLLEQDESWRQQLWQRFAHIFVDEFQDINLGQYRLIRLLAPTKANICVIGDPDQAIYGFRGSDARFFNQFAGDYPDTRLVRLTRNYRSTETILQASFQVIQDHQLQLQSGVSARTYSQRQGERTITILEAPSARAEAVAIGLTIEKMVGGTGFHAIDFNKVSGQGAERGFSDFAILFRTTDQGRLIADVLSQAGIPCQQVGKHLLHENRAIAKLLALMRVIADQGGYVDLNSLTDLTAPGISRETLDSFKAWAYANQLPLAQAMSMAVRMPITGMSRPRQQRLTELVHFIQNLKSNCRGLSVPEIITRCVARTMLANTVTAEDLETLLSLAESYGVEVDAFLAGLALRSDTDLYRPEAEKVSLMTMHAAKGLEFNVVFVAGCETGLIPYHRSGAMVSDPDEERRLFFVAMTRAKQQLFLAWARQRLLFGKSHTRTLSPFVTDIQRQLLTTVAGHRKPLVQQQLSLF